ncbi:recombinase family protein [Hymenobacter cellulosivorans]|uniref:Recombinase family protein n=1 Tax=Hymenobacter cellulosivorans TaxID=2932249 RepID=A0ABY4F4L9_9BACT|nr:recombinase family protein [Hymenobacter cellulosivorans]
MGKFMLSILALLAVYNRQNILEKTPAGQQPAAALGKPIGPPKELDADNLIQGRKVLKKPIWAETVERTGICLFSVKRY